MEDREGSGAEARSCRARAGKEGEERGNLEKNTDWFQGAGSAHHRDEERLHLVARSSFSLLSKAWGIRKVGGKRYVKFCCVNPLQRLFLAVSSAAVLTLRSYQVTFLLSRPLTEVVLAVTIMSWRNAARFSEHTWMLVCSTNIL